MIDSMTLLEVEELFDYWTRHPPAHIAIAAALRIGNRRPAAPHDVQAALAALGPGFSAGQVNEGLPPVRLDFAALKMTAERG